MGKGSTASENAKGAQIFQSYKEVASSSGLANPASEISLCIYELWMSDPEKKCSQRKSAIITYPVTTPPSVAISSFISNFEGQNCCSVFRLTREALLFVGREWWHLKCTDDYRTSLGTVFLEHVCQFEVNIKKRNEIALWAQEHNPQWMVIAVTILPLRFDRRQTAWNRTQASGFCDYFRFSFVGGEVDFWSFYLNGVVIQREKCLHLCPTSIWELENIFIWFCRKDNEIKKVTQRWEVIILLCRQLTTS